MVTGEIRGPFTGTGVTLDTGSGGVNVGTVVRPRASPCNDFLYLP